MNKRKAKIAALSVLVGISIPLMVVSNEARKEIYYLCGNFKEGVAYSDVIRQLNTISMSSYQVHSADSKKYIIHASKLNLGLFKCTINFDGNDNVSSAIYE